MAAPDPVQPDDIYKAIIETITGPDSFILYVAIVVMAIQSWISWARSTHAGLRMLYAKASEIPAAVRLMSVASLVAACSVQAVFLVLSYFLAAHLPRAIRDTASPAEVDVKSWMEPPASPIHETAFQIVFAVAILFVLFSWWGGKDRDRWPGAVTVAILGGLTALSLYVNENGNPEMSVAALIYFFVAMVAFCAPGLCKPRPASR
ncbi:hypothetical protein [Streptomyces lushanensis]|uniref:hypothetical protein n=1 Tax=Streptomyces lushanensis TaxID=1434255 RepID=UPI0008345C22|nr:hypothetical protein [Streptomyces lushanensis]